MSSASAVDEYAEMIGKADPNHKGAYFDPGVYPILYIDKIQPKKSRKDEKLIILETEILESEVATRPAGSRVGTVYNLTKHELAPGNVRVLVGNVLGVDKDHLDAVPAEQQGVIAKVLGLQKEQCAKIDGGILRKVLSPDNPLHGRLVRTTATATKTEKEKKDFTLMTWEVIPEEMQAMASDLRVAAGFPPI